MRPMLYCLPIMLLTVSVLLTSCSSLNSPTEHHRAVCATLKSQLIFGGGTNDTRRANIENAEQPRQQQAFDKNKC